jgi:DNA-binding NarL/FixJ family response regulator
MTKQISVFIVDDNFVARRGLRSLLQTEPDIVIAGEASTGRAAIEWMKSRSADVILMDVRMPDTDGIAATSEILKSRPDTRITMLTVMEEQPVILKALLAGAKGYLVYGRFSPEELIGAIHTIDAGGTIAIPPIAPALLKNIREHIDSANDFADMADIEPLTSRESEILTLIALGKGNRDIADALEIEEKTVKNNINNIYSKLQIKSRYEAISYMLRQKP